MRLDAWKESVKRLDDRFGDFQLAVKCPKCGHERLMTALALANVVGWDNDIAAIMARMVCSKCRNRGAAWTIEKTPRPRGRGIR